MTLYCFYRFCSVKAMLLIIDCKYHLMLKTNSTVGDHKEKEPFLENGDAVKVVDPHFSKVLNFWISAISITGCY